MKPFQKPLPWWEEYLGIRINLEILVKKLRWPYICVSCFMSVIAPWIGGTTPSASLPEIEDHIFSQPRPSTVVWEGENIEQVQTKDLKTVSKSISVPIESLKHVASKLQNVDTMGTARIETGAGSLAANAGCHASTIGALA